MKTQRRHELQTNTLADKMGHYIQQAQPYYRHIGMGLVAAIAFTFVVIYLVNQQAERTGRSWADFFQASNASDPKALEEIGKLHAGETAALWARQLAGDVKLAEGARLLFRDRDDALKSLQEAETNYAAVEKEASSYPFLVERARFGLAQTYESMSKLDKAREYYDKVVKLTPESSLGKAAKQRSEHLADESVESWYNWFDRQKPAPPPAAGPAGKTIAPDLPAELDAIPDKPNLPPPAPDAGKEAPAAGDASQAAPELKPAAETKPAADAKPAAEAKPTTEAKPDPAAKPAAEPKPAAESK